LNNKIRSVKNIEKGIDRKAEPVLAMPDLD